MVAFRALFILVIIFHLSILSCQNGMPEIVGLQIIRHPSANGGQSNLALSLDQKIYSSWLEYLNDSVVELKVSQLVGSEWSAPATISAGANWFVNWADFPSVASTGTFMLAHWLQYLGDGPYEYDIRMSISEDQEHWESSFVPHRDGVKAEHGFVSLLPLSDDQILAVWLDGRFTASENDDEIVQSHDHNGVMTLRSATVLSTGELTDEVELDNQVCDCCQTSSTMTDFGPVVVYRNRTHQEIRDIYIVRNVDGVWQEPNPVFNDGWKIGGCPVNGPSITSFGKRVAVAWFTMANDQAMVKLIFSEDGGANFSYPLIISDNDPLGRVDVEFIDETHVLVTWLESENHDQAVIYAKIVTSNLSDKNVFSLAPISSSRSSGFPRLLKKENRLFLSWTNFYEGKSEVKTAEIKLR